MALPYTILLVDDDDALLDILGTVLREPGYTVVTARDGYEAVRILAERQIDLMLTDVIMPGLDGQQLAEQARVMRPHLHIIYLTGFNTTREPVSGSRVVAKPIRPAELLQIVRQQLTAA